MNRLQLEIDRLYLPRSPSRADADVASAHLIDASGNVRAMVMELARPANWGTLSKVWHGVQVELELPAPAIAVSGVDGLQLWFSLAEPIPIAQAHKFLYSVRQRYMADVKSSRIRLMPALDASVLRQDLHAARVPAQQADSGNWSAFLAPDLVPVFAEAPWLDIPPSEEGQASLLRDIAVMTPAALKAATAALGSVVDAHILPDAGSAERGLAGVDQAKTRSLAGDAAQFLRQVMNDETVSMALRVEAAKVLLQHGPSADRAAVG